MAENKVRRVIYVRKEDQDAIERIAYLNGYSLSHTTSEAIRMGLDLMLNSNVATIRT